nr:unnamed protein product [Callosobruchus chinensis]
MTQHLEEIRQISWTNIRCYSVSIHFTIAVEHLDKLKDTIEKFRTDEHFRVVLSEASQLGQSLGVEDNFPIEGDVRKRKKKKQFDYEAEDENISCPENNFRINFFFAVLDTTIKLYQKEFSNLRLTPIANLFKKYSETVLKLTDCSICGEIADKYVEYDTVIVIIDLILLNIAAYRHILFNSVFKNFWKLAIVLLVVESYSTWLMIPKNQPAIQYNITEPDLPDTVIYLDNLDFYKVCLNVTLSESSFVIMVYILTCLYTRFASVGIIPFEKVCKTITLSSSGMFLLLPSLIWDIQVHEYHLQFISLYTTLSQLIAHKALCDCYKVWSLFVIFFSYLTKLYVMEKSNMFLELVSY